MHKLNLDFDKLISDSFYSYEEIYFVFSLKCLWKTLFKDNK